MKYRFYIAISVLLVLFLTGCAEKTNQPNATYSVSNMNDYGETFFFNSFKELVQKKQETIQNIESLGGREALMKVRDKEGNYITVSERDFNRIFDPVKLTSLDCFYLPVYIETLCRLDNIMVLDSNISAGYVQKNVNEDAKMEDVALEMHRAPDPEIYMSNILKNNADLKPWQEAEGVYYEDVINSSADVVQFHFLSNGECFFMRVSRELIDEIRKTDPEALNGALFELRKIDL